MAVFPHKFQRMLKKVLDFKKAEGRSYEKLEIEERDEKKKKKRSETCGARKGYVPIYVGEDEGPKILYEVPMAAMNSPAFVSMLDEFRDDIIARRGPLTLPCSAVVFENVLSRAIACA